MYHGIIPPKPLLQESITRIRNRIKGIRDRMRSLRNTLVEMDLSDAIVELNEYQSLNEHLRKEKIKEAELVYLRNML